MSVYRSCVRRKPAASIERCRSCSGPSVLERSPYTDLHRVEGYCEGGRFVDSAAISSEQSYSSPLAANSVVERPMDSSVPPSSSPLACPALPSARPSVSFSPVVVDRRRVKVEVPLCHDLVAVCGNLVQGGQGGPLGRRRCVEGIDGESLCGNFQAIELERGVEVDGRGQDARGHESCPPCR